MTLKITLAIESSCDETAAAVVRSDGLVLSDVKATQIGLFAALGGVVPEIAARAHTEKIMVVIDQALKEPGVSWDEIDRINVTKEPGLIGSLLVGQAAARALALAKAKPLKWVNHLKAHFLACWLYETGESKPQIRFPAVGLLVSGGHTELLLMQSKTKYEVIGSTIDDAAGEAFDKVGKLLGLPYPGGPEVSKAASHGDPKAFAFPRALMRADHLDFSFSGLKTAVLRTVEQHQAADMKGEPRQRFIADVAASFEEAVVDALTAKTLRAVKRHEPRSVILAGGVAANTRLRARMQELFGNRLYLPKLKFCTDNAAMVGLG